MAPVGQLGRQSPKPSQKLSRVSLALPFTISMAPSWQAAAQAPQPLHFSSSIWMILRIMFLSPFLDFMASV